MAQKCGLQPSRISMSNPPLSTSLTLPTWRDIAVRWMIVAAIIRLLLAAVSLGSNDAVIWKLIADAVSQNGMIPTYRESTAMNHPPLMVLWAETAWRCTRNFWGFAFLMKVPAIAGDVASIALATKWLCQCHESRRAKSVAAFLALNPVSILVSGYHCNTDSLYAFLSLLTAYYLASPRRSFFIGGLALGAAINVKLIPVLLIPAGFSLARSWREAAQFLAGLALCVTPFLILLQAPQVIVTNMLNYASNIDRWGFQFLSIQLALSEQYYDLGVRMAYQYKWIGRILILSLVVLTSLFAFFRQSKDARPFVAAERLLLTYTLFLVLAPGFGVQYTTILVPLLAVVSFRLAWLYAAFAGIFIGLVYFMALKHPGLPLLTIFPQGPLLMPGPIFGVVAWLVLIVVTVRLIMSAVWARES